jgi:hypothetical protein
MSRMRIYEVKISLVKQDVARDNHKDNHRVMQHFKKIQNYSKIQEQHVSP